MNNKKIDEDIIRIYNKFKSNHVLPTDIIYYLKKRLDPEKTPWLPKNDVHIYDCIFIDYSRSDEFNINILLDFSKGDNFDRFISKIEYELITLGDKWFRIKYGIHKISGSDKHKTRDIFDFSI